MPPIRIQRKRTKGWRMPPNTVYVGRPTIWGNPFHVYEGDRAEPAALFLHMMNAGGHSFFRGPRRVYVFKALCHRSPNNPHLWSLKTPHLDS